MAAFQSPLENLKVQRKEKKNKLNLSIMQISSTKIHQKNHLQITDFAVYLDFFFKDVFPTICVTKCNWLLSDSVVKKVQTLY